MGPVRSSAAYKRILRRGNPMGPYLGDCTYDPLLDIDRIWFGEACPDCGRKNVCPVPLEEFSP